MEGYIITVVGLICFLEGLPYFALPDQIKNWLRRLIGTPSSHLRIMGGLLMLLGLLLVYWGRHHGG